MKLSERVRYAYELLESRSENKINMLDVEEVAQFEVVVEAVLKCWPYMFEDIPNKGRKSIYYEKLYEALKQLETT